MTPEQRACKVVREQGYVSTWDTHALAEAIRVAIVEATNAEIEKRRAVEQLAEQAWVDRIKAEQLAEKYKLEMERLQKAKVECTYPNWPALTDSRIAALNQAVTLLLESASCYRLADAKSLVDCSRKLEALPRL